MPNFKINTMRFPGGKRKALTLSYDDGVIQDRRLVAMLDRYGVRATFNLNSALLGRVERKVYEGVEVDISTVQPAEVKTLYRCHEIATHGSQHYALTGIGAAALAEILEDRAALEEITGGLVRGHAYPFGLYDERVLDMLRAAGIDYARTVVSTHSFELPRDFLTWNPTCHHKDPELIPLVERFCTQDTRYHQPQLFYLWGHAYEFDIHQNWDVIERFLDTVSAYQSQIWMATNGEIVRYLTAYDRLQFSASGKRVYNPTDTELWLGTMDTICRIPAGHTVDLPGSR